MATRILVAVVLAPLFFVVLFFLPPVWLAAVMAAISAMAAVELLPGPGPPGGPTTPGPMC